MCLKILQKRQWNLSETMERKGVNDGLGKKHKLIL